MILVDQTNHPVNFGQKPLRIISLVPSQTELLYYLGLEKMVVGITKFCVHPTSWFKLKTRVGGTKNVNIEKIKALAPTHIIANKEENTKAQIELLRQSFEVYTSDINSLDDSYQMMRDVGLLTSTKNKVETLIESLSSSFKKLPKLNGTVLYLIWNDPYMSAGCNTFINSMLILIGLQNADVSNLRYNEISKEKIIEIAPDYIFLSSEPFPFKNKHIQIVEKFSDAKTILVDGEMFSWYGSRLLSFKSYIENDLLLKLD
ncbi:MAG: ABC transporter substrate-binding protein [Crocinitomicaceae bacterium]